MLADVTSALVETEEDEDNKDTLIEQGFRMASDFLSTRDGEPAIEAILAGETATAKNGADLEDGSSTSSQRDNFITQPSNKRLRYPLHRYLRELMS
jgi:hypothetical protein